MKSTKVITCTCKHDGQDKIYGNNKRLANRINKSTTEVYRCTICAKEVK